MRKGSNRMYRGVHCKCYNGDGTTDNTNKSSSIVHQFSKIQFDATSQMTTTKWQFGDKLRRELMTTSVEISSIGSLYARGLVVEHAFHLLQESFVFKFLCNLLGIFCDLQQSGLVLRQATSNGVDIVLQQFSEFPRHRLGVFCSTKRCIGSRS